MFCWLLAGFIIMLTAFHSSNNNVGVLPLNMGNSRKERMGNSRKERMGNSRKERMGKQYVNRKWIPTLLDKK